MSGALSQVILWNQLSCLVCLLKNDCHHRKTEHFLWYSILLSLIVDLLLIAWKVYQLLTIGLILSTNYYQYLDHEGRYKNMVITIILMVIGRHLVEKQWPKWTSKVCCQRSCVGKTKVLPYYDICIIMLIDFTDLAIQYAFRYDCVYTSGLKMNKEKIIYIFITS